uniref:Uncharacterized protein n=1 Tax=viral metagenome TaxID=1070528 RepID=A0A6M3K010_9ZZZZ
MEIKGTRHDWEAYEELKKKFWIKTGNDTLFCKKHNVYFDDIREPCSECWDECEESI